jgi:hypothetical protein
MRKISHIMDPTQLPLVNHNCFAGKPNLELMMMMMMMGGPNPSLNGVS